MSTEAFNTMRKNLVESVTGSAMDWLSYMGTDAALASIPDTNPPRYVVAGTLADIVKLLPATEAFTVPPLTTTASLTDWKSLNDVQWMNIVNHDHAYHSFTKDEAVHEAVKRTEAKLKELNAGTAPAPQQSESIDTPEFRDLLDAHYAFTNFQQDETAAAIIAYADGKIAAAKAAPAHQQTEIKFLPQYAMERNGEVHHYYRVDDVESAVSRAKAAPAAPVQRIPDILTVETIQGAIAFGRMGINPPPSPDHWGNEFWQIGRQLAKLGETSAWDNVTPVDVAAPVQADQAQVEPVAWMNPETLDVIHDTRKRAWENDFGMGGKAKAAGYTYRLVAPAQAEQVAAVPDIVREAVEAAFEDRAGWRTKIAGAVRALATKEAAAQVPAEKGGAA